MRKILIILILLILAGCGIVPKINDNKNLVTANDNLNLPLDNRLMQKLKTDLSYDTDLVDVAAMEAIVSIVNEPPQKNCDSYLMVKDDQGQALISNEGEVNFEGEGNDLYIGKRVKISGQYYVDPCEALCICGPKVRINNIEIIE